MAIVFGFSLFVLFWGVSTVFFINMFISPDWGGFRKATTWMGPGVQVIVLLLLYFLRAVIPVLLAWLVFRARDWARPGITIYVIGLVLVTTGPDPIAVSLAGVTIVGILFFWLPPASRYLKGGQQPGT